MSFVLPSRVGVDTVAGTGQILGGGQFFVTIAGALWTVIGDAVGIHGGGGGHTSTMVSGVPWITIGGLAVCVAGSAAACTHITTGSGGFLGVEIP